MDTDGLCTCRPQKFVVSLSDTLDEERAIETLLHEWAHAMAWNYALDAIARQPEPDPDIFEAVAHGEAWGCAYARVYRAYLDVTADGA